MTHWRVFVFFFYEDLGQPHKNLDPRITTFLGVMQDQELNSFQLRIFCDLVILWILKSLLSVLTGLQQHMDEDNRTEVFGSGPKFPHSPLQDCQPQPTDPGGRRQAEQELVFTQFLPQGCSSSPFLRVWFIPEYFWAGFRWDDLAVPWVWLLPLLCFSLQFLKSSGLKPLWQKSRDLQGSQGLYFHMIQNQQDTSLMGNKLN